MPIDANSRALVDDGDAPAVGLVHDLLGVGVVRRAEAVDAHPPHHVEVARDEREVEPLATNLVTEF